MILPTYTEDQILPELLKDYSIIRKAAKKHADKHLLKAKKTGRYIRGNYAIRIKITTASNNNWYCLVHIDQTKKNPWSFQTCCIVEGINKKKEYYLVRGVNTDKPYFIKITSHVIKRYKERNKLSDNICKICPPEYIVCYIFNRSENIVCCRYMDLNLSVLIPQMEDANDFTNVSLMFYTRNGIYFGFRSASGNYLFKTFITRTMGYNAFLDYDDNKESKWSIEGQIFRHAIFIHQYYNKFLYDKEDLEDLLYRRYGKNGVIELNDTKVMFLLNP